MAASPISESLRSSSSNTRLFNRNLLLFNLIINLLVTSRPLNFSLVKVDFERRIRSIK